ncbi:MAG: sulfatase-like hydrolase/transferase, partial [Saprospiraceae bacterium]|nr:sulfatase-like hydrolase/transferase [Saprospiraceae bacterium]
MESEIKTRIFFYLLIFSAFMSCKSKGGETGSDHTPNIVMILADDQGWGDLSINGNSNLSTPHIDRIGQSGAMFDRFYV